jgi:antirestriction protein ArdC
MGGFVKKGEKSLPAVFWQFIDKKEKQDDGSITIKKIPFLRVYNVFNVEQCEGLKLPENKEFNRDNSPIEEAENVWKNYANKPLLSNNPSRAYYAPGSDYISIPKIGQFESAEEYYSTLFHEAIHSTGAKKRLDRFGENDTFGSEGYGKEELVAEIGAQILCQYCGITRTLENAAAYCKSWCSAIKAMPATAIISAASQAQKAVDLILGIKFEEEEKAEE